LASHLLGRMARVLSHEWQTVYGHRVYFVETLIDRRRYRGICYRAANWQYLGQTQGRGKDDLTHRPNRTLKDDETHPQNRWTCRRAAAWIAARPFRAIGYQVPQIGRASRSRIPQGQERLKIAYRKLLYHTACVVGQAPLCRSARQRAQARPEPRQQAALCKHQSCLETMIRRVRQVMRQTRERLLKGNTHVLGKFVSLFEPHTEIIRKGNAAKPTDRFDRRNAVIPSLRLIRSKLYDSCVR
jgi:hypothetical protein